MNTKLLALLLFCCTAAFSQDYIPFLNNTSWIVTVAGFTGSQDIPVVPSSNVTIDGNTYVPYNNVPLAGNMLIREDVAARRVYRRVNNTDELLYDFSLQVNDMVEMPGGITYTVTARDSMWSMTGRKRVRIDLEGNASSSLPLYESWIEGVGTWAHPLKHFYELPSDPATMIKCSFTDGEPSYNSGLVNTGGVTPTPCEPPVAGIDDILYTSISISPNPMAGYATLISQRYLQDVSIILYNPLGQEVKHYKNLSGSEIALFRDGLPAGLYYINAIEAGKMIYSGKIVVKD